MCGANHVREEETLRYLKAHAIVCVVPIMRDTRSDVCGANHVREEEPLRYLKAHAMLCVVTIISERKRD